MANFLTLSFLGNTVSSYLTSSAIFVGGVLVVLLANRLFRRKLGPLVEKSASKVNDVAMLGVKTLFPALLYGFLYLSLSSLNLHPGIHKLLKIIAIVLFTFLGVRFVTEAISALVFKYWIPRHSNKEMLDQQFRSLSPAFYIVIWAMASIFIMDNLGFKVSAVLAGLGVGGVALALASQAVLADLFSYFAILFDRPFVIGDFIVVGTQMGTIEKIGIKTTRIRSLGGEQLVFGNKDLTGSTIQNFKRMSQRRIVFNFGVDYETTVDQLRAIPTLLRDIILAQKLTVFDRAHFKNYDPSSLTFEVVYIVLTDDFNKYMDIQQEINLRIKQEFEARNIDFAHPLQKAYARTPVPTATPLH